MKKSDWIYIGRLTPPENMRVLGFGRSSFNGKRQTLAVGYIKKEDNVWRLTDEERGIEGLYDVKFWQHIKLPRK